MTAAAKPPFKEYQGNGVTVDFAAEFRFNAPAHVLVRLLAADGTVTDLAYGSDYSAVGGQTDAGGTVTLATAPPVGSRVQIRRATPRDQSMNYTTTDTFPAESHEGAIDKITLITQELDVAQEELDTRSVKVPIGETAAVLPAASERAGKFAAYDASGNPIGASGTGSDPNLRTDLATQPEIVGSPAADGGDLKEFLQGFRRKNMARAEETIASAIALSTGRGYVGNDAQVAAAPGFTDLTLWTLAGGNELRGIAVDGANVAGPIAGWAAGRQKGGAAFATGTDPANRISDITIGGTYKNFPNGAFNFEYVDGVRAPEGLTFINNQTAYNNGAGHVTCADLTGYYGQYWDIGVVVNRGYGLKGTNCAYMQQCHFAGFITVGGQPFFACTQFHAGQGVRVDFSIHDGDVGAGYGMKLVGTRQFHHGPFIAYRAQEAVQVYGAQARFESIDSEDHERCAIMCDAYQSRDDVNIAEVDLVVGDLRAIGKPYTSGTVQNGITVRGDNTRLSVFTGDGVTTVFGVGFSPSSFVWNVISLARLRLYIDGVNITTGPNGNGIASVAGNNVTLVAAPANGATVVIMDVLLLAPIRLISIKNGNIQNGYSGLYEVRTPMSWIDRLEIHNTRIGAISSGGYIAFNKARDIDIDGLIVEPTVRQGMLFFTDAMNRSGKLRINGVTANVSASWNTEPLLRLGYTGTVQFSEAGWERIELTDWEIDGNLDASFKAISIHGHRASTIRHITLRGIKGINCPLTEQIYIDLSGHGANTVILDIDDVLIVDAAGVPGTININDPAGAIFGGEIHTAMAFTGTGRPSKCWPKEIANTQNLAALATGATSAALTAAVPGLAVGDRVEVLPGNVNVSAPDVWISSAGNVAFTVTNRTGANLSATEPFTIRQHRRSQS